MIVGLVAKILGAIVSIYTLLCTLRVLMTWLPGLALGKAGHIIAAVTDPFLGLFSRMKLFRTERFDFSPIAALATLSVLNNMLSTLAMTGKVSVGLLLNLVLWALWSALSFVISFLAFCALLRIIVFLAHWNSLHPLWVVLDAVLNPFLFRINHLIYRHKAINYLQGLITGFIILLLARTAGAALVRILGSFLLALPF